MLKIDNVSFRYPWQEEDTLKDLSVEIEEGYEEIVDEILKELNLDSIRENDDEVTIELDSLINRIINEVKSYKIN